MVTDEKELPGETLFEHPSDVKPSVDERVIEVLYVVLPDGDMGFISIFAPWGAPLRPEVQKEREEAAIAAAGREFADEEGPREPSVLERRFRIERRETSR